MNASDSSSESVSANQTQIGERELFAFVNAVTELFGPKQARVAAEDWLEEAELRDAPARSTIGHLRMVTIAASTRLATRINAAEHRRKSLAA
jgi:hypothetical protein